MAAEFHPWAVLLAAGRGSRMTEATNGTPKQFFDWQGAPLYWHSAMILAAYPALAGIVFVFPPSLLEEESRRLGRLDAGGVLGVRRKVVAGGELRQDSVFHGIQALPSDCGYVLIHDAARPFISPLLVNRICEGLKRGADGVVPTVPVCDTIKIIQDGQVFRTLPRDTLAAAQTPQGFSVAALKAAHLAAQAEGRCATDDASLLEACGREILTVKGDPANRKITYADDLAMLVPPLPRMIPCSGLGYDVHRYSTGGKGRPLRLGGIPIPGAPEVLAHSDGDVLLHALMDALLGAAGLGDIGQHFPDTAPEWDNISSSVLLDNVLGLVHEAGVRVLHADITIIAQVPKISPHSESIRRNIARLLGLDTAHVNLKATTEEGLGFTGAGEGIKTLAQVSVLRPIVIS